MGDPTPVVQPSNEEKQLSTALKFAFVVIAGLLAIGCSTVGRDQVGIENFDQVSPTLYRGAQPTEAGFRTLAKMDVKTVVNLRSEGGNEEAMVEKAGMKYVFMPMDADTVTPADAMKFLKLMQAAKGAVF